MSLWTHYDNLKVSRNASFDEIKASYRNLVFMHHPDRAREEEKAEKNRIMKVINHSYSILSDYNKRLEYDKWLFYKEIEQNQRYRNEENHNHRSEKNFFDSDDLKNTVKKTKHKILSLIKTILIIIGALLIMSFGAIISNLPF